MSFVVLLYSSRFAMKGLENWIERKGAVALGPGQTWPFLALIKLGRTRARSPHGPNLEPFGSNPYGVKLGDVTGPTRNHQTPAFTGICHVFFAMLRLRLAQLRVKLSPKVTSCGMSELIWASMCINLGPIWIALDPA